jgi:hypothetical protein
VSTDTDAGTKKNAARVSTGDPQHPPARGHTFAAVIGNQAIAGDVIGRTPNCDLFSITIATISLVISLADVAKP